MDTQEKITTGLAVASAVCFVGAIVAHFVPKKGEGGTEMTNL